MSRLTPLLLCLLALPLVAAGSGLNLHVEAGNGQGLVRKPFVHALCGGDNISPRITWRQVPPATRSFVLTVFDPDANKGAGWWHWAVLDLPASTRTLAQGAPLPDGARSLRNDFGQRGWGGPCPPRNDPPHHYRFTLYALDTARLPIAGTATPAQLLQALHGHVLARDTVTLRYGR